jgi:choloylglycine hydrolase
MRNGGLWFLALALALTTAWMAWPAPAAACTGMVLEGEDGTVVYGRTQEWAGFDFQSQAAVYPRGHSFQAAAPGGAKGLGWKAEYGFVSYLLMDRVTGDGMNEKGLAAGSYYHEGFAQYAPYDQAEARRSLGPTDVVPYLLSNFATVREVRQGLARVRVVAVKDPDLGKAPPVHFLVADASGDILVIEYRGGKPVFHHNPVGVITNNPTFGWHLQNLRNYGNLSGRPFERKTWGELEISPLSVGSGLLGLPGDFTSPSRFVRAVVLKQVSYPTQGGMDTVEQLFRILDSFNVPTSQGEGKDEARGKGRPLPSCTQWTVASDTTNLVTYYHTAWNRRIREIDLKEIDFGRGAVRKIPLDERRAQSIQDVTPGLR